MKSIKLLRFKVMDPNQGKKAKLVRVIHQFRRAANFYLHEIAKDPSQASNKNLPDIYPRARSIFELKSALCQQAGRVAIEAYKSYNENTNNPTVPHFDSFIPVRYDKRTMSVEESAGHFRLWVGLTSFGKQRGRVKVPIEGGDEQFEFWRDHGFDFKDARLVYDHGELFLQVHVQIESEIPQEGEFEHFIGVDLGVNNLAVAVVQNQDGDILESQFFDGGYVGQKRKQFNAKRREYATKNLWSKLKSSKGKERRFMKDQNHKISRAIVDLATKYPNSCIVMEKLDGIRKRIGGTKKQNRRVHNWNFAQLQEFVQYKAHYAGIAYRKVPAYLTSQVCRHCLDRAIKRSSLNAVQAVCQTCKKEVNTDFTAAVNIVRRLFCYIVEKSGPCESGPNQGNDHATGRDTAVAGNYQLVPRLRVASSP